MRSSAAALSLSLWIGLAARPVAAARGPVAPQPGPRLLRRPGGPAPLAGRSWLQRLAGRQAAGEKEGLPTPAPLKDPEAEELVNPNATSPVLGSWKNGDAADMGVYDPNNLDFGEGARRAAEERKVRHPHRRRRSIQPEGKLTGVYVPWFPPTTSPPPEAPDGGKKYTWNYTNAKVLTTNAAMAVQQALGIADTSGAKSEKDSSRASIAAKNVAVGNLRSAGDSTSAALASSEMARMAWEAAAATRGGVEGLSGTMEEIGRAHSGAMNGVLVRPPPIPVRPNVPKWVPKAAGGLAGQGFGRPGDPGAMAPAPAPGR